jgi:hypothetical protein
MRSLFHHIAAAVALALVGPSIAEAQRPQTRDGWWFSVGTGIAALGYGCQGCDTLTPQPKGVGPTVRMRLGGTFTTQLLLGLEAVVWMKSASDINSVAWMVGTVFYYYPHESGGFFFGGGLGHMGYSSDDGTNRLLSNGFGLTAKVGRDYRIGPKISFTPVLSVAAGGFGAMRINEALAGRNFNQTMIELGVGITIH